MNCFVPSRPPSRVGKFESDLSLQLPAVIETRPVIQEDFGRFSEALLVLPTLHLVMTTDQEAVEPQTPPSRPPLEVLYPESKDRSTETYIDIIAVHGLGSSVDWSWTWRDKSGQSPPVHWLKDLLPAIVPKARIIVYNYDSKWHSNAPKVRLQLCAEDLVQSVFAFCGGRVHRPVIFIGHSLGGLVIQHGLVHAHNTAAYSELSRRTVGFLALGSPFLGSKMHTFANKAAQLMSLSGSHRGIIDELELNNPTLVSKIDEFCQLPDMPGVTRCFFELYETDYGRRFRVPGLVSGMVVSEDSACIPGCERFPLQTDHLKLNKYSGPNDRSFLSVSEQIRKLYANSKAVLQQRNTLKSLWSLKSEGAGITQVPQEGPHWMVPFGRNEGFVGRKAVIEQLLEMASPDANTDNCQRTAIEGLGGVGKTHIALETAFQIRDRYPDCSIFWVPAVDVAGFENAYRDIGRRLGIEGIDEGRPDITELVRDELSREGANMKWLLIIDNADDTELLFGNTKHIPLSEYLPFNKSGSILFTTRNHEAAVKLGIPEKSIIKTTGLSSPEALEMLQMSLDEDQIRDTEGTTNLLNFLTNLPLAIKQASAFMATTRITTARYLDMCQQSDKSTIKMLSKDFKDLGRYKGTKNPIAATWLISFDIITRDHPLASQYLQFLSFLGEKDIPAALLPPAEDEIDAEEAIGILKAYAFISQRQERQSFDIHRLVRLAMRNWIEERGGREACVTGVLKRLDVAFPFPNADNRDIWLVCLPHVQAALEFREFVTDIPLKRGILFNLAVAQSDSGKFREAEQSYQEVFRLEEIFLGKDHPGSTHTVHNHATVLGYLGRYEEAEERHRKAIAILIKEHGKEHHDTLLAMNNLAVDLFNRGCYKESEELNRELIELGERVLGKEDSLTLDSNNGLGNALALQGKAEEAEVIFRQTLKLREKVLGKEHSATLTSRNNLASVLKMQKKYKEAEQLQRQTVKLKEKTLGREHPDTIGSVSVLAHVLGAQDKFKEAEQMHRRVVELMDKVMGPEHPLTIIRRNDLKKLLYDKAAAEVATD
ncbi:hypothetical protein B0H67DRAFT_583780 [Lasiosphaeris hirsuta]|uniref:NB-ARC domain-containing protein n=1 Tax=Lasiosphaeris hirsuta TaxID=260670 RepID=A0AA40DRP4_9PEZI|nr:hypothetical protein B0H67DRAFT_583780 [Lasiosphaeris hirsuta]